MAQAEVPPRVAVEERLFSLVLALLVSENGLTKSEILATVQGYRQKFSSSGASANLERLFERDKDDIRELGVPLETVDDPANPGNNQSLRYRISPLRYRLPGDISFTAAEIGLLNLAALVWREGSLSAESRRSMVKLRSMGQTVEEPVLGYASRLRSQDAAFAPLTDALDKRSVVRFAYLKPGQTEATVRQVQPLALVQHQGRWYVDTAESISGARKTFLLRRIVSSVFDVEPGTVVPAENESTLALQRLDALWESQTAEVTVVPFTDAAARLGQRRNTVNAASGRLTLHYSDFDILADELAAFGPEVYVVSPIALQRAVRDRLRATVDAHSAETQPVQEQPVQEQPVMQQHMGEKHVEEQRG
ncbi:MAG: WYL domain-containing protein [Microbacteriaceae bacterium]|nr:WYL domain-containing protein [Microbacteriaceae bacterium]